MNKFMVEVSSRPVEVTSMHALWAPQCGRDVTFLASCSTGQLSPIPCPVLIMSRVHLHSLFFFFCTVSIGGNLLCGVRIINEHTHAQDRWRMTHTVQCVTCAVPLFVQHFATACSRDASYVMHFETPGTVTKVEYKHTPLLFCVDMHVHSYSDNCAGFYDKTLLLCRCE